MKTVKFMFWFILGTIQFSCSAGCYAFHLFNPDVKFDFRFLSVVLILSTATSIYEIIRVFKNE